MKPSALGYTGGLFSNMFKSGNEEDYGTFTGEAPRTSLVQPPAGYQTPSPAQPYGVSKGKPEARKGHQGRGHSGPDRVTVQFSASDLLLLRRSAGFAP